jgi:hypothetical protein
MESQIHFRHAVKENAMSRPKLFGKIANRLPCLISVSMLSICSYITTVAANEVMTDRCSREVAITPTYNDTPGTPNTVVLTRGSNGEGSWSKPFQVSLDSAGHIRWWCHSTAGNLFDPGTWRFGDPAKILSCAKGLYATIFSGGGGDKGDGGKKEASAAGNVIGDDNPLEACKVILKNLGTSAHEGWTPERSRCDNHSTLIRARLGQDRLLQIECLGR